MTTDAEPRDDEGLLDAEAEHELAEALRSAWAPEELDPDVNERLIELALEDPLAPANDEEVAESERLRAALESGAAHPDADLARALRAAADPDTLDSADASRLADDAISERAPRSSAPARRSNVVYVAFGATAAVAALAAAVALVIRPAPDREPAAVAAKAADREAPGSAVAVSRSTAELFAAELDVGDAASRVGRTSERVDRIAMARGRDLRQNRYASWGLR